MAHIIASWNFDPCAEHADLDTTRSSVEEFFDAYVIAEGCTNCTTTVAGGVIAPEPTVLRKRVNH
ncbi:hypothetical protein KV097_18740 [Mumia sp. zg.B17]|uniref:hypothetical protein n=1 Tax=Mumia sp. zg.B17 TaxID=2855446 RepID=UPI001C6EAF27|nr:hypothetical protein [Mumia sp. zg.B17]MBW9207981.1 hypothetical protein [Mumia sp. zg.B17]